MKDRFLVRATGYDSKHWVARVQALIWSSVLPETKDDVHPECDEVVWLQDLGEEVALAVNKMGHKNVDGNILCAWVMSTVLATWASRISHAKAYDPNRPLRLRRKALKKHRERVLTVVDALMDETVDYDYFPQEFNPPYGPQARGGKFV